MPRKELKLFVWEDVLNNWTNGIMFALAYDADHARQVIRAASGEIPDPYVLAELEMVPRVVEAPEGFIMYGGC